MSTTRTQKRNARKSGERRILLVVFLVAVIGSLLLGQSLLRQYWERVGNGASSGNFEADLEAFAANHHLTRDAWPQEMVDAVSNNPELGPFVLNYPIKKDQEPKIDLSQYRNSNTVPLLFQWDERWGYADYSGGMIGFTGCGPTCLSMVGLYLRHDSSLTPRYVAEFSQAHGYSSPGNGSKWTLISEGGRELGMDVRELPLERKTVMKHLEEGHPIICVMGPGDFTTTGHFIVLAGSEDGKIRINDPNSKARSERLWEFDQIQGQIKNLWVCM